MAPLALAAGPDAMGTRRGIRAVFEAVDKGVEGPDRGRLERGEASDLREARMGAQVVGPLRQTFIVEQQHEQEGPEHTDGVVGRPTAGAWGIECRVAGDGQGPDRGGGARVRPRATAQGGDGIDDGASSGAWWTRSVLYWACDRTIGVFSLGERENRRVTMVLSYLSTGREEKHWIFEISQRPANQA